SGYWSDSASIPGRLWPSTSSPAARNVRSRRVTCHTRALSPPRPRRCVSRRRLRRQVRERRVVPSMDLPTIPLLSAIDGTLIDSKASVIAAFRWWAAVRGLSPTVIDRIPFGRTSTDAAAMLAPHLDAVSEGAVLDDRQGRASRPRGCRDPKLSYP